VHALTPPPLRDAASQAYVEAVAEWAPDDAARTALGISDPLARWQRVETCLARWWEVDAISARLWLQSADLPEENKRQWFSAHGND
jgi:hypothetical protein